MRVDPFALIARKAAAGSTAAQFVGVTVPLPLRRNGHRLRDWELENAIEQGYKASAWVYSCARVLANHCSGVPWKVYARSPAGDAVVVEGHDIAYLLENPNPHLSRPDMISLAVLHLLLGGNALWKIVRVGNRPAELWPLRPDSVDPIVSAEMWISGYEIKDRRGRLEEPLPPSSVVHALLIDPSMPHWGMGPLRAISRIVDMDLTQVAWNRALLENDATPSGVFTDPNIRTPKQQEEVKKGLKQRFSGPLATREPMVLTGDAKWVPLGIAPKELDWIESRKFTVGEICTAFGLLTARFLQDAATYNNLQAAIRYEWENGAIPLLSALGNALTLKLFTPAERRKGLAIRADLSGVRALQDDVHKGAETYERLVRSLVPPQTAAAIVQLPVGEIEDGDRSWRTPALELVDSRDDLEGDDNL